MKIPVSIFQNCLIFDKNVHDINGIKTLALNRYILKIPESIFQNCLGPNCFITFIFDKNFHWTKTLAVNSFLSCGLRINSTICDYL